MAIRRAPTNLVAVQSRRTADVLRELAEITERDGAVGCVVSLVHADKSTELVLGGLCEKDRALAYFAAGKLHRATLNT